MIIKYDVHEYQKAMQKVRDAFKFVNDLPGNNYAIDFMNFWIKQTALSCKNSLRPDNASKPISPEIQIKLADAMIGIVESYKALYHPETDPNKIERPGSDSDFETDKKTLEDLTK